MPYYLQNPEDNVIQRNNNLDGCLFESLAFRKSMNQHLKTRLSGRMSILSKYDVAHRPEGWLIFLG
jgi:hypothetical protein